MKRIISRSNILMIEDVGDEEIQACVLLQDMLEVQHIHCVKSLEEAEHFCMRECPDIIVINDTNSRLDILSILRSLKRNRPFLQFILIVSEQTNNNFLGLLNHGLDRILAYPLDQGKLIKTISQCAASQRSELTGLYQKIRLIERLGEDKERVLILCDVDNLEYFNNSYGYEFGDAIIERVADLLDMYKPEQSMLYIVSGNVFGIMLQEADLRQAEDFATIINVLASQEQINIDDISTYVTFTIGIAKGRGSKLISQANMALREAKEYGNKHYCTYSAESRVEKWQKTNLLWMDKVKSALEEGQVHPWYQPIINNKTFKIEKFECLARVQDHGEVIGPGLFL